MVTIRVTLRGMEKQTVIFASGNISRKVPYNKLCTSMNFYVHPVPSELHKSEFKTFKLRGLTQESCLHTNVHLNVINWDYIYAVEPRYVEVG